MVADRPHIEQSRNRVCGGLNPGHEGRSANETAARTSRPRETEGIGQRKKEVKIERSRNASRTGGAGVEKVEGVGSESMVASHSEKDGQRRRSPGPGERVTSLWKGWDSRDFYCSLDAFVPDL
jgi:hypothetical protein